MKKTLIAINLFSFVLIGNLCANSSNQDTIVSKYTNMFEKIGKKRVGIEESKINSLTPPFVTIVRKVKSEEGIPIKNEPKMDSSPILKAIFNEQVKIGEQWYKLHDKVDEMEIVTIKDNYILLKNEKSTKKLKLGRENENMTIK